MATAQQSEDGAYFVCPFPGRVRIRGRRRRKLGRGKVLDAFNERIYAKDDTDQHMTHVRQLHPTKGWRYMSKRKIFGERMRLTKQMPQPRTKNEEGIFDYVSRILGLK